MALVIPTLPMTGSRLKTSLEEIRQRISLKLESTSELNSLGNFTHGDRCTTPDGSYEIVSGLGAAPGSTVIDMLQEGLQAVLAADYPLEDVTMLLADTRPNSVLPEGQSLLTRSEQFIYRVADSGVTDHHLTTAGGVKLYVEPGVRGFDLRAFGATGDGITDDTDAMGKALSAAQNTGTGSQTMLFAGRDFAYSSQVQITKNNTMISFDGNARMIPLATGTAFRVEGAAPTSWISLAADAEEGATTITLASPAGWSVGEWIELRSESPLPGANTEAGKCALIALITDVSGTTLTLDRTLPYDFTTAASAVAGQPSMIENVVIDGAQINRRDFSTLIGFGIYLKYCANVIIRAPRIYGSKPVNAADQSGGVNGISIGHGCINVTISDADIAHVGWYGISISGYCEGVRINGGEIRDCRHGISLVWLSNEYGEPHNITITGVTARDCNQSCFDTHDTGRSVIFDKCRAFGSRTDSGFQIRNQGTLLRACESAYNHLDGIIGRVDPRGLCIETPKIYRNGRNGIVSTAPVCVIGGSVRDNAQTANGNALYAPGGCITGTELLGQIGGSGSNTVVTLCNATSPAVNTPLQLSGVISPADNPGVSWFLQKFGSRDYRDVTLTGCDLRGYSTNLARTTVNANDMGPRMINNVVVSTAAHRSGRVTLAGSTTTVSNSSVTSMPSEPFWTTKIKLTRVSSGAADGVLSIGRVINNSGFTILSTQTGDNSVVEWEIIG